MAYMIILHVYIGSIVSLAVSVLMQMGGHLQADRRQHVAEQAMEWHNGFWQPPKDRPKPAEQPPPYRPAQASHSHHPTDMQNYPSHQQPAASAAYDSHPDPRQDAYQQRASPPGHPQHMQNYSRGDAPQQQPRRSQQADGRHQMENPMHRGGNDYDQNHGHGAYGQHGEDGAERRRGSGEEAGARALADRAEAARMTAAALQKLNYRYTLHSPTCHFRKLNCGYASLCVPSFNWSSVIAERRRCSRRGALQPGFDIAHQVVEIDHACCTADVPRLSRWCVSPTSLLQSLSLLVMAAHPLHSTAHEVSLRLVKQPSATAGKANQDEFLHTVLPAFS